MPVEVVWSRKAREHLLDIYVRIGSSRPSAAERFFERIEFKVGQLKHQPRLGQRRPDIGASARVIVEPPYLILYETRPDTDQGAASAVEIVDVVDGRRDLAHLP